MFHKYYFFVLSFFILDKNVLSKHKINYFLKNLRGKEVILRDRKTAKMKHLDLSLQKKYKFTPFIQNNCLNPLKVRIKGMHFSVFYDKLMTKARFSRIKCIKRTASAHNQIEILRCNARYKPNFILVSPIFFTKSHPRGNFLGILKLFKMINQVKFNNFILLGGMSADRFRRVKKLDFKSKIKGFASLRNF